MGSILRSVRTMRSLLGLFFLVGAFWVQNVKADACTLAFCTYTPFLSTEEECRTERFNAWVTEEVNRGTGWMTGLEECPDKLQTFQPYPLCDNGLWSVPAKAAEHGNHWCMRSNQATADGAGQQCCYYDAPGSAHDLTLIKWNEATGQHPDAGTPDLVTPGALYLGLYGHFDKDVEPWCDSLELNRLADYMRHRPPSNGGGRACTDVSVPGKLKTWLDSESQRGLDWVAGLADCPSSMTLRRFGRGARCNSKKWSRLVGNRYSSRRCMSSAGTSSGFRQKCCYTRIQNRGTYRYTLVTGIEAGTPFNIRRGDFPAHYAARQGGSDALVAMFQQYRPPSTGGGSCQ